MQITQNDMTLFIKIDDLHAMIEYKIGLTDEIVDAINGYVTLDNADKFITYITSHLNVMSEMINSNRVLPLIISAYRIENA